MSDFTDDEGGELAIVRTGSRQGSVFVTAGENGVFLRAHQVAAVARALYEAAGLTVPDLPDIPDPELVAKLAEDIEAAATETAVVSHDKFGVAENRRLFARALLARGWGRTS